MSPRSHARCPGAQGRRSEAPRADAARGLTDVKRLGEMLVRAQGRISLVRLDRVSPLAVTVLLEIGRESVWGEARDALLAEAEEALVGEATDYPEAAKYSP